MMTRTLLVLFVAAGTVAAGAQTQSKPATHAAPAHAAARHTAAHSALPAGIPPARGPVKTAFALRYQDIKVGTGAEAEPGKLYEVQYTGWLASDGRKFDSSYDHRAALHDKDGSIERGADGQPKMSEGQPFKFVQGNPYLIQGWNLGFIGMHVGGKRRIFIPWQLAYGEKGRPGPDAAHPGIPAKADLIFDIELLSVTTLPLPQGHEMFMPGAHPMIHGDSPHAEPAKPAAAAEPQSK